MKRKLYFGAFIFKNGLSLRIKYGFNIIFQPNISKERLENFVERLTIVFFQV